MEINKRKCKICLELKDRILVGKFDHKNKKYQDNTGKTWNGNVCPSCHKERVKNNMKKLRSKE